MHEFVNLALLKNPLNWVIVVLMVTIAGFAVDSLVLWNRRLPDPSP